MMFKMRLSVALAAAVMIQATAQGAETVPCCAKGAHNAKADTVVEAVKVAVVNPDCCPPCTPGCCPECHADGRLERTSGKRIMLNAATGEPCDAATIKRVISQVNCCPPCIPGCCPQCHVDGRSERTSGKVINLTVAAGKDCGQLCAKCTGHKLDCCPKGCTPADCAQCPKHCRSERACGKMIKVNAVGGNCCGKAPAKCASHKPVCCPSCPKDGRSAHASGKVIKLTGAKGKDCGKSCATCTGHNVDCCPPGCTPGDCLQCPKNGRSRTSAGKVVKSGRACGNCCGKASGQRAGARFFSGLDM